MRIYSVGATVFCPILAFLLVSGELDAQAGGPDPITTLNGSTPNQQLPGNPRGTSILDPREGINLSNGNVNFSIPLYHVGGRGNAGYDMVLPIQTKFQIENHSSSNVNLWIPQGSVWPFNAFWAETPVLRYTPGRLVRRNSTDPTMGSWKCASTGISYYQGQTLTRISWIEADGTEHEFRDTTALNGNPSSNQGGAYNCSTSVTTGGPYRGTTFEADDATAATFIADAPLYDGIQQFLAPTPASGVSGWLLFRDGSRYQTDSLGNVILIQDKNGNQTEICIAGSSSAPAGCPANYGSASIIIIDSLNRQTNITYATLGNGLGTDTIQYLAAGSATSTPGDGVSTTHTISVNFDYLHNHFRSGFASTPYATLFPTATNLAGNFDPEVVASVLLPDQTNQYTFLYNNYGEIARVVLPTGGAYEYDYPASVPACSAQTSNSCAASFTINNASGGVDAQGVIRRVTARREYPDGSTLSSQTQYSATYLNGTTQVSETISDGLANEIAVRIHFFFTDPSVDWNSPPDAWYPDWTAGKEYTTQFQSVTLSQSGQATATTVKQVDTSWGQTPGPNPNACQSWTTLMGPSGSVIESTISLFDQYSNRSDLYEYNYGSAPADSPVATCPATPGTGTGYFRHTVTTYLTNGYDTTGTSGPASNHMRDLLSEVDVKDSSDTLQAKTTATYDGTTAQTVSNAAGWTQPTHTYLGNLTSVQRYVSASASVQSSYVRNVLGNVLTYTDPNSNQTTYDYTDHCDNGNFGTGLTGLAFITTITDPLQNKSYATFDCAIGALTTSKDVNGIQTKYTYSPDPYDRIQNMTQALGVAGDETQTEYSYSTDLKTTTINSDFNTSGDGYLKKQEIVDGLGRHSESRNYLTSSDYISVMNTYDALDRAYGQSNPFDSSTQTAVYTTKLYDGANRVLSVQAPDGSVTVSAYDGNSVTVTDPASVSRKTTTDSAGRLTGVVEYPCVSGGACNPSTYTTAYAYDLLDDLKTVTQSSLTRSFSYDWLKRLVQSTNPESGAICYGTVSGTNCSEGYDSNGNLLTKTDARNIVTTYRYDALNRITSKSYSDGTTPAVAYTYDTVPDGVERLASVVSGSFTWKPTLYDSFGRVKDDQTVVAASPSLLIAEAQTFGFAYKYKLSGALYQETYPSSKTIATTAFDGLGRPQSLTNNGANLVTGIAYAPHGPINQLTLGSGVSETTTWDPLRLQAQSIVASNPSNLLNLNYYYCASNASSCTTNNGNILSQQITVPGISSPISQAFTYDGVNRLSSGSEPGGWNQTYIYDAYGNRAVSVNSYNLNTDLTPTSLSQFNAKNQWQRNSLGDTYDASGNQTGVGSYSAPTVSKDLFTFDAESRMITSSVAGMGTTSYLYDGNGRRAEKISNGVGTVYVYDAAGDLAEEYTTAATTGGTVGTDYFTADALGSTRLLTGTVTRRYDYLPFGDELPAGTGVRTTAQGYGSAVYPMNPPDVVSQKFTGKERDSESGLDYFGARYFSGAQGRFTSPDPKMFPHDITDPQSWNKYGYTRNNPLRFTDPNGEDFWDYLVGAANAFGSDNALGAGRATSGNSDFKTGQAIGDAVATLTGTLEALGGGGEALVTSPAALTGVGIVVPAAGAAVAAHGVTTAAIAGGNLANAAFASINEQKQAGHEAGTPQNDNRINQGKPTSTFKDAKEGRDLTQDTHATGTTDPKFPNQKTKDYGRPVGTGANGGDQTRVRVHEDSRGKIHGHPDGPEQ